MKTTLGLWIDHRQAMIAVVSAKREATMEIRSNVEKQPGWFAAWHKRLERLGLRQRVELVDDNFAVVSAPGQGTTIRPPLPFRNGT